MNGSYFKDKVIIITGASSGIGLASAKLFASFGAKLALAARSIDKLEALAREISSDPASQILCVKTDVSKEDDCRNLVEKTVEKFGCIDILVNNAGISMRALFKDCDLSVIKSLMDVNFWGTVYCTKFALPYLLASRGSVVGVISIAGFAGLPGRTGYSSSKYAIRGFLDTLRIEHLYDGLHVMIFAPGFTASNVRNAALTADGSHQGSTPRDEGKMMSAEECAMHLAKGLRRRKSEVILTPIGKLTVFMHNILPRLTDRLEFSYMAKEPGSPFHK
ncbi:MAG: SDR family oxidoreductase [Bacteroidetes bacterium]|uniref:SDR family oxidoreductase n=1 Tax=Candidatus Cryptobacteroides intestinigallinarum TaxID=2840767 RepID=A0A9D9MYP1_9BACT|nr:SDR family oxidoreductase [Candidatus Cryptobacteroides intestinigallinarum]